MDASRRRGYPASVPTPPPAPAIDPAELRRCLGTFVTGVTVITALTEDGVPIGMTANSFNSVSLDPPLIVWSLRASAGSFPVYSRARRFVVNILSEEQVEISNRFARPGPDRFAGVAFTPGIDGVPLIDGCAAHLECRMEAAHPGGDHVIFLGRVERIARAARKPLAFGGGRYMVVHPHDANELNADVGSGNVATLNAIHLARPVLEALNRETDKTVGLGVWGNLGPTLIWWIESSRPLTMHLRCGMVLPLLGSATGKVFAAFSPPALVRPYIEAELAAAQPGGDTAFASRAAVDAHLALVRERRLGSIRGAFMPDINETAVHGDSAPVFDAAGKIVLALTMIRDAAGFDANDPAIERLSDAARRLSARLGYRG